MFAFNLFLYPIAGQRYQGMGSAGRLLGGHPDGGRAHTGPHGEVLEEAAAAVDVQVLGGAGEA